jgi:hypothetical protein
VAHRTALTRPIYNPTEAARLTNLIARIEARASDIKLTHRTEAQELLTRIFNRVDACYRIPEHWNSNLARRTPFKHPISTSYEFEDRAADSLEHDIDSGPPLPKATSNTLINQQLQQLDISSQNINDEEVDQEQIEINQDQRRSRNQSRTNGERQRDRSGRCSWHKRSQQSTATMARHVDLYIPNTTHAATFKHEISPRYASSLKQPKSIKIGWLSTPCPTR